ncbi:MULTISPECIES: lipoprotein [Paracoccus]|nr:MULTISPECIES: lipoprotein [Paracoccus]MCV2446411.1 lipoprotein [Paracoccus sp. DMF]
MPAVTDFTTKEPILKTILLLGAMLALSGCNVPLVPLV